jgi:manganese/zinc/iron transport system substrate-binding protein
MCVQSVLGINSCGRHRVEAGWLFTGLLLIAAAYSTGCSSNHAAGVSIPTQQAEVPARGQPLSADGPFTIVTTCGMVTDIVKQVVGERAQVTGLMGEGVDPHLYKPTRNDTKQLLEADMVFYSGLLLEGRMSDTFAKVARTGKPVFAVTEGIAEEKLREPPEFAGHFDPHVWMNVKLWSECVDFVAKTLAEVDPPHAAEYQANATRYRDELRALDEYAQKSIASIPAAQRVLITAHDAFGYFAKEYSMEVRSVQGISTESQAGMHDINKLVDFIVESKIQAIFVETSVSEKNIRAIVEGAGQRGWAVKIGGQLFSDAMGAAGTYEGTYIGMIDRNVTVITHALGGSAPEKGMQGKLSL